MIADGVASVLLAFERNLRCSLVQVMLEMQK